MNSFKNNVSKGGFGRLLCFSILVVFGLLSCTKEKPKLVYFEGKTMGTDYHIRFTNPVALEGRQIDSILHLMNDVFSTYDKTSFISAYNGDSLHKWEAKHPVEEQVEHMKHFFLVTGFSQEIYYRTSGAFDPSGGPLFNLWGFGEEEGKNPSRAQIESAKALVGLDKLSYSRGIPTKPFAAYKLNFNAIAKGYAVDVMVEYFLHRGFEDFMVEIGGEVRAHGRNPDGKPWVIGVNEPEEHSDPESVVSTISLKNMSVATSGNYRRFYRDSTGNIIGHTIDPRTGYPANNDLISCSAIHPSCAIADAYATAAMVIGADSIKKLALQDTLLDLVLIRKINNQRVIERTDN
jgi:thiamine biosynthesis lipoprotein